MSPCGNCNATEGDICEQCTTLYFALPWMLVLYNFNLCNLARLFKECGPLTSLTHYTIHWDFWAYRLIAKYHKYRMDYELNIAYRAEMSIQSESEDEDEESYYTYYYASYLCIISIINIIATWSNDMTWWHPDKIGGEIPGKMFHLLLFFNFFELCLCNASLDIASTNSNRIALGFIAKRDTLNSRRPYARQRHTLSDLAMQMHRYQSAIRSGYSCLRVRVCAWVCGLVGFE